MREMRTLSKRVKQLRTEKNYSIADLAARSGLSKKTVARVEKAGETLYNPPPGYTLLPCVWSGCKGW